jgi:hypothetical protein
MDARVSSMDVSDLSLLMKAEKPVCRRQSCGRESSHRNSSSAHCARSFSKKISFSCDVWLGGRRWQEAVEIIFEPDVEMGAYGTSSI